MGKERAKKVGLAADDARQQNGRKENSQVKFAPLRALLLMDSTDRMIETSSGSGIRSGM